MPAVSSAPLDHVMKFGISLCSPWFNDETTSRRALASRNPSSPWPVLVEPMKGFVVLANDEGALRVERTGWTYTRCT